MSALQSQHNQDVGNGQEAKRKTSMDRREYGPKVVGQTNSSPKQGASQGSRKPLANFQAKGIGLKQPTKGKKAISSNRVLLALFKSSAESSKGQFSTSLILSSKLSNGTFPNFCLDFQFINLARPKVGDKCGRHDGGNSRSDHYRN